MRKFPALSLLAFALAACGGDGTGPNAITVTVSSPITTVIVGASAQFTATARDANGSIVTNVPTEWTSSAPTIATVSETGLVSGVAAGQATITAKVGGSNGSLAFTVQPNPSGSVLVTMPGFSFAPFTTTINRGGTVVYEFPSEPHNVIFNAANGAPQDIQITANRRVPRTFNVSGNFPYDCTIHPGMSGVVIVR